MPHSPPSSPPSSPDPRQGEFLNGEWRCNCEPRLVAKIRTVNTNKEDYGKRFYACPKQRGKENSCDMFILVKDAKKREREYLMTNGRSEKKRQTTLLESMSTRKGKRRAGERSPPSDTANPRPTARGSSRPPPAAQASTSRNAAEDPFLQPDGFHDTTSEEDEDEAAERIRRRALASTPSPKPTGAKRKRPSQEEDYLEDLSSSGAEELVAVTDKSSRNTKTLGKRADSFITPSAPRSTDMENGMVTPSLTKGRSEASERVERLLFADEGREGTAAKRQRLDNGGSGSGTGAGASVAASSHPSESSRIFGTDATISSTPPLGALSPLPGNPAPRGADPADLTKEVMDLLKGQDIAPLIRTELRKILERHVGLAKGYERSRDVARKAARDLQARVDEIENGKEALKTALVGVLDKL
ncbi:hypothetical protein GGR51DRAFT_298151 [Nemania sp. FL0031]|nr:hypothetical protein GGR51DRAFT_298151 [Nemania sp. FL0031]